MASGDPLQGLREEATCSICLDYFASPATIDCGHSFCRACLVQYWAVESGAGPCCPQCREATQQRVLRPNLQLANLVQLVRQLKADAGEDPGEASPVSCKDDPPALLWPEEGDRSAGDPAHHDSSSSPAEEASLQYKRKIKSHLTYLEKEREKLVNLKLAEELERQECLTFFETEKKKAQSAFERMQLFLMEKQHLWLGQLEDLEKAMGRTQEGNLAKLSEEISRLNEMIAEMKWKYLQPTRELLQDTRSSLSRYEKNLGGHAVVLSPMLEEKLRVFSRRNAALEKAMENYKDSLEQVLQPDYLKQSLQKANVTLDPDTAHPFLILSQDLKGVRRVQMEQDLPFNPERFDTMPYVLGCNKFTSGRHWWEVEVWGKATWAVGVATESVRRRGGVDISPHQGIWAMGKPPCYSPSPCQFLAFTAPQPTDLTLRREPRKIRVALDCEAGCVEFSDADTEEFIFAFPQRSFFGETIRPFLQVCCDVSLKC